MNRAPSTCLTEQHLLLFGTIIQWFARYELVIQEIMASAAGCDSGSIIVLTKGLDFSAKRRALFDLLRHRNVPLDRYDRINAYLMVPYMLTPIRNYIVHSVWISGLSSNWIQPDWVRRLPPSIKPFHGEGLIENEQDKVAYSLEDLNETVETLASNYHGLADYLREVQILALPDSTGRLRESSPGSL
jgi:hypothetical protein